MKRLRNHKLAWSGRADLVPPAASTCGLTTPTPPASAASRKVSANSRLHSWNGPATAFAATQACNKRLRRTSSWKEVPGRTPRPFRNAAVATKGPSSSFSCAASKAFFFVVLP